MPRDRKQPAGDLAADIQTLTEHVQILWQVLDEIRDELRWRNNNVPELDLVPTPVGHRVRLTSMSADPTAPDFGVNSVDHQTVDELRREATAPPTDGASTSQPSLFT